MTETAELPFPEIVDQAPAVATVATPVALQPAELNIAEFVTTGLRSHEPLLVALATKHAAAASTLNVSTPAGMRDAKARRLELREHGRFKLQRIVEALKKDLNGAKALAEKEVDRLIALVKPEEDRWHNAIQAEEDRIERERQEAIRKDEERKDAHRAGVRKILSYITLAAGLPAERIARGILALELMKFGPEWEEFQGEAEGARGDALAQLRTLHAQAIETERLREENERLKAAVVTSPGGIEADASTGEIKDTPPAPPAVTESAEKQVREAATPAAAAAPHAVGTPAVSAPLPAPAGTAVVYRAASPTATTPAEPVKLGDLNERLGFTMTEHFVRHTLGITPVPGKGRAVLIAADDLQVLRVNLLAHIKQATLL